jgi:hypothetical protein
LNETENGNSLYKNLTAETNNEKSIEELVRLDGSTTTLASMQFSNGDAFKLKQLLPDYATEALAKLAERMRIAWQRKRKGGSGRPFLA